MNRYTCTLGVVPPSYNVYRGWSRQRQDDCARDFKQHVWAALNEAGNKCPKGLRFIDLKAVLYFNTPARRDSDNRAMMLWKWVKDVCVDEDLIPDDTQKYCRYHEPVISRARMNSTLLIIEWEDPSATSERCGLGDYLNGCARKRRFRNEAAAEKFGRKWGQRAYECGVCGFWHLTTQPERKD